MVTKCAYATKIHFRELRINRILMEQHLVISRAQALACEAVQRRACFVEDLVAELEAGPSAGSALLRAALAEVADGVRSVAEADFRVLILRSDLPRPVFNARLIDVDGTLIAITDAWWQEASRTASGPSSVASGFALDAASGTPIRRLVPRAGPGSGTGSRLPGGAGTIPGRWSATPRRPRRRPAAAPGRVPVAKTGHARRPRC